MFNPPLMTGPFPAYANPPIEPQFYKPRNYVIESIALGKFTTVTTSVDNDYVVGQQIRFVIPEQYGTRQLNQVTGYIISIITSDEFVVDIDSSQMDAFISATALQQPQVVAIGDINTGQINSNGRNSTLNYIPGSFQNISPQ